MDATFVGISTPLLGDARNSHARWMELFGSSIAITEADEITWIGGTQVPKSGPGNPAEVQHQTVGVPARTSTNRKNAGTDMRHAIAEDVLGLGYSHEVTNV